MIVNQYANYFCPKLFSNLENDDRIRFLAVLKPYCVTTAMSKVGTYPLQIIIELIKTNEERFIVVDAFKDDILDLCFVSLLSYISLIPWLFFLSLNLLIRLPFLLVIYTTITDIF